jgi:HAD superfamily hydrolase (TIGR01509 family)
MDKPTSVFPATVIPEAKALSPIQAVLFDCDGTLIDSEDLGNEVLLHLVREHGIPLGPEEVRSGFRGGRLPDYIALLEKKAGGPLPETFVPELRRRYREALATRLQAVPGALELLAAITLPMALATNGQRAWTESHLAATGMLGYFAGRIFSAHEVGAWKPDPKLFLIAAAALGVAPAECAVVEDSLPGILAGAAAGMRVFAYLPHGLEAELPRGVITVSKLSQLAPYLAPSPG